MAFIPLAELAAAFQRKAVEVMPGLERVVGALMEENAIMSREMLGREDNPGWARLADSTIAEKEALGYVNRVSPTDPVLRSGDLAKSIEPVVSAETGEVVGEVGTDVPYARDQEFGTAHIPPRPFLAPPFLTMEPRAVAALGELALRLLNPGQRT